jgi:tetratricopeptide (TPR) repeat protein
MMVKINLSKIKLSRIYVSIFILSFLIYGNSINNEYAMDDNLVTEGVAKVEEGIKGIPKIFTTPMTSGKQTYGYRPTVQTTFAIEKQLFKGLPDKQTIREKERKDKLTQANISHFVNVLLYAFLCIVLFSLLSELFHNYNIILPLTITFLFLVHPLHTEVVDNLKSRDELLMLLSLLFSLKYYLKYAKQGGHIKNLLIASLFVLFAALSKKNAMVIIGLIPVVLYFYKAEPKKILFSFLSVFVIFGCFILMKKGLVSEERTRDIKFFENPLKYEGDFMDRITVGLFSSWFYLKMLIYPKDLSFYYGYNQIPMANWSNWQVWASLVFYISLGVYGVKQFVKRNIIGLGIAIWLGGMLGVVNVLFPIVGIVADRFAFTFSIGFCIVLGYLLLKFFKLDLSQSVHQISFPNGFLIVFIGILVVYSVRTIARNPDWHDQMTLYEKDIEHLEESAKAHALLANTYYPILSKEVRNSPGNLENRKKVDNLIFHYKEAIRIDSTYLTSINNLGSVYMNFLADYNNTIYYCEKAVKMDGNYLEAHVNLGHAYNVKGDFDKSLYHYSRAIEINPANMTIYQTFNKVANDNNKIVQSINLLTKSIIKVENPKNIYLNIANLYSLDNYNVEQSLIYFVKAFETDRADKQLCEHIVALYNSLGKTEEAKMYFNLCK